MSTGPDEMFERMLKELADGTGFVELDVQTPVVSADLRALYEMDRLRSEAIERGERVAYLYRHARLAELPTGIRQWSYAMGVHTEQARRLLAAGATWVGPDHQAPR